MANLDDETYSKLTELFKRNPDIDWRSFEFRDAGMIDRIDWRLNRPSSQRAELLPWLKAYQRLLHILPPTEDRRAWSLLKLGLHSAIQIAGLPRDEFSRLWNELFPGEEALGRSVHAAAHGRRSELLHYYIHDIQRNEPHYRSARFR